MDIDDCIKGLRSSDTVPKAALTAGLAHADALAPMVFALAEKLCRGVYLMPDDNELLFNGLHILAAARHPGLLDHIVMLARQPADDLNRLFPDYVPTGLARLLLTTWDRPQAELFQLIEHADLVPEAKWALYDVLARLTFDGRIARADTVEFLARIEQGNLIDDDDQMWWGWEQAVARLGLVDFEPALRRVWHKPVYAHHSAREHDDLLTELRAAAAANPQDPAGFDAAHLLPITDPVEAMAWIEKRAEAMAKWAAEEAAKAPPPVDADVAKAERLTDGEGEWLRGLLVSRQVPETTMPLDALDGFMTALVIGPAMVPPSEYLPEIWGAGEDGGPTWDGTEQAGYAMGLLIKHWNAIAARRTADAAHVPLIETFGVARPGEEWAQGFLDGLEMRPDAWEPFFLDRKTERLFAPIELLAGEMGGAEADVSRAKRIELLARLPETVRRIASYWQNPASAFPRQSPVRTAKVGRNEPCPCGSGKKFKKCCGASSGSTVH